MFLVNRSAEGTTCTTCCAGWQPDRCRCCAARPATLLRWSEQPGQLGEPDLTPSDVGLRPSLAWDRRRG